MRPLTVLQIASGDLMAGAEHMLLNLCRAQGASERITPTVALMNYGRLSDELEGIGVPVYVFEEKSLSSIDIARRLIRLSKELCPNVIHTHRTKENIIGSLAAHFSGIPSIRTVHGATERIASWYRIDKHAISALDAMVARRLQSACVAVSNELRLKLEAQHPTWKLTTIANGLDPAKTVADSLTENPEAAEGAMRLVFLGRLVPVKRVDKIIRAVAWYKEHIGTDITLSILGDGPLRQKLCELTSELDLTQQVRFLGNVDRPLPWLRQADALVLASEHEGLPMCVLESLALGIPVLAPKLGGLAGLLNPDNSIIYEHNSLESIAAAMTAFAARTSSWDVHLPVSNTAAFMEQAYSEVYRQVIAEKENLTTGAGTG